MKVSQLNACWWRRQSQLAQRLRGSLCWGYGISKTVSAVQWPKQTAEPRVSRVFAGPQTFKSALMNSILLVISPGLRCRRYFSVSVAKMTSKPPIEELKRAPGDVRGKALCRSQGAQGVWMPHCLHCPVVEAAGTSRPASALSASLTLPSVCPRRLRRLCIWGETLSQTVCSL